MRNVTNAGTITRQIGLDVEALTGGTTDIGVRLAKADTYTLQLSDTGGTAAGGITFGSDVNLYRSAANILKTDDSMVAATFRTTTGIVNDNSSVNAYIKTLTTGTEIERNIADANPALIVEQLHASSTGDILQLSNSGGVKSKFTQNGVFFPVQAPTASAPTYVIGGVYFDTTLNKLRVGGAAGWETITSV